MTIKKVFLQTFGCQMNVRDSEVISGLLKAHNYDLTAGQEDADVIIFNTCSVRQHAEDKVWSEIGRIAKSRRKSPSGTVPLIGLVGCMAQNYQQGVFERSPAVDFVVGPSDIQKIPEIIRSFIGTPLFERKIWETDGQARPEEIYHTGFYQDEKHAYVVISEGCSNFCSYCVVPFVRGPIRHRDHHEILKEIKEALNKGVNAITLLGQNVNAYEYKDTNFVRLLERVNVMEGLKEFSFITSHPKDTSTDLFKAMAGCQKLKKCLHLPVQSGSDRILKLMNRGYSRGHYLELVAKYRKYVTQALLSTDIIVGFPSEKKEDYQDTYDLVKDVGFDSAYIFKYSVRPQTAAQSMEDDVPQDEKEKRHRKMLELQKKISKRKKA